MIRPKFPSTHTFAYAPQTPAPRDWLLQLLHTFRTQGREPAIRSIRARFKTFTHKRARESLSWYITRAEEVRHA